MISVLIPTYNYDAFTLVKEIRNQLLLAQINFEIICLDDGSKSILNKNNQAINLLSNASFNELEHNIGRSAIRNLLAKKANYKWLLFLDADVFPKDKSFIKKYIEVLKKGNTVFCGGLSYKDKKEYKNLLRYKFGKKYEEIPIDIRKKKPAKYFFTSNFLLPKKVFETVFFEEKLTSYGREDTLFSIELTHNNFTINHIENEVYHLGLDNNSVFIAKTKKAMENIIFMEKEGLIKDSEMTLLKIEHKISKYGLSKILGNNYPIFEKLSLKKSSIFFLNCLKVAYLCHLKSTYE